MNDVIQKLLILQNLEVENASGSPEGEGRIAAARAQVPNPILAHYDRLTARGKKGVSTVRHGVCGECHIGICTGTLANLLAGTDIQICQNCGRYLHLPEGEPLRVLEPAPAPKPAKRKTRKRVLVDA